MCARTSNTLCGSGSTAVSTVSASTSRTTSSGRSVAGPAAGPLRIRRAPHWDREALHDIYRSWRRIADSYDPPRVFVAEAWVESPQRLVRYVRSDELHTAFNFDFLASPWLPGATEDMIDATLDAHASVAAPSTWVLSNHDVARHVSRYARPQREGIERFLDDFLDRPADLAVGTRRARAAILQMLALPGCAYVYMGEELRAAGG